MRSSRLSSGRPRPLVTRHSSPACLVVEGSILFLAHLSRKKCGLKRSVLAGPGQSCLYKRSWALQELSDSTHCGMVRCLFSFPRNIYIIYIPIVSIGIYIIYIFLGKLKRQRTGTFALAFRRVELWRKTEGHSACFIGHGF
jgi:hypothetical protein